MRFDQSVILEASNKHFYIKLWKLEIFLSVIRGDRVVVSLPNKTWRVA